MKPIYVLLLGLCSGLTALAAPQGDDAPAVTDNPSDKATATSDTEAVVPTDSTDDVIPTEDENTIDPTEGDDAVDRSADVTAAAPDVATPAASTLLPGVTKYPDYKPPYDWMAKICRPVTVGSAIKQCRGPFTYGRYRVKLTCPHWAYLDRFKRQKFHMTLEVWRLPLFPWGKPVLYKELQIARFTRGIYPNHRECGWLYDKTTGTTLYDQCEPTTVFSPAIADPVGYRMMTRGFKPYIDKMASWDQSTKLYNQWRRFIDARDCITLARYMAWEAGPVPPN